MRFPVDGEGAAGLCLTERLRRDLRIILEFRRLARHHAAREHHIVVIRAGGLRQTDQRILAGTRRADHQHQPAGADPACLRFGYHRGVGHATRCPSRQTLRTTGTSCATWTRITSARLPTAISPRSTSPTASAGRLVTVRIALARSMDGTLVESCNAPIRRLDGT